MRTLGSGHPVIALLAAAKVLGLASLHILQQPELVEQAWATFQQDTKGQGYVSPLPAGLLPPLHQLGH